MQKILIISPHFPPSNLAAVHRARLFANHLPAFGWEPYILTVHEDYYEEKLDYNLLKLVPAKISINKVKAFRVSRPRIIGDIGLRAFFQLYKRAKRLIVKEKINFLYIPIPSFYTALLGRWLHATTGVKYGIDYIDPWVHEFPGNDRTFSRAWFSTLIAKKLEPIAVKNASLITGVAKGYYTGVLQRNTKLMEKCVTGAMPYGGEVKDFTILDELKLQPYLFKKEPGVIDLIYAGVLLPNAVEVFRSFCEELKANRHLFNNIRFHFIGTGKVLHDPNAYYVGNIVKEYDGLWNEIIFEYPQRIPYLDVLIHLKAADGVLIIGSTQPHYTPSKVYQGALSGKPVLALLHEVSTACKVIESSKCGLVLGFNEQNFQSIFKQDFINTFTSYLKLVHEYDFDNIELKEFEEYSAKNVTEKLAHLLDNAMNIKL